MSTDSRVWSRRPAALALGVILAALVAGAWAGTAHAQDGRSYRISDVRIAAELRPDGALHIVEDRTFAYDGQFRGAFYTLPLRPEQRVTDFALSDSTGVVYRRGDAGAETPGTYVAEQWGHEFEVTWFYATPAVDETRTFRLEYTVSGAGVRHADSAELYWKWIGTGWDVPTDLLVADLRLPPLEQPYVAGENLRMWGHGPLHGSVFVVEPGVVRTEVEGVEPETFVELRVLLPAAALPRAPSDGLEVTADILAEEACLATAANADRARAEGRTPAEDCDPRPWLGRLVNGGLAVGLLAGFGTWAGVFRRFGREYALPHDLPDYERDLPADDQPALVGYLLGWGNVGDEALVATILDLARRGHVRIRREQRHVDRLILPDKVEEFTVIEHVSPAPTDWERDVQDLLFDRAGDGHSVTDEQLREWVQGHRQAAYSWWQSWTAKIERIGRGRHWVESKAWMVASVLLGALLVGGAVAAFASGRAHPLLGVAAILAGIGMVVASPVMRRRTATGRVLHHRWQRFGAFLRDYSLMADRTPDMLPLWGRYLVYAVPLGVADEVMRNLDARLSAAELETAGGGWYPYGYADGRPTFAGGFSGLSAAIPSASIASSPSSSSGGGGGFSGGGGGGGGGSGGGAF